MIEIIWEFIVKDEACASFELEYGAGGAWDRLFAQSPGFRGTVLLHDMRNPQRYLTVDKWDTLEHLEQMLAEHRDEYSKLDAVFGEWTESETEVGIFRSPE